jgi:hypothetical protein
VAWVVTLKVTDCNSSALLPGAAVTDGTVTYFTDVNGQFIAVVDDYWENYGIAISKANYYTKNFVLTRSTMAGTLQTVCLGPKPPPDPNGGTTNGGW